MNTKTLLSAALVTGSMLMTGLASAATLVTINSAGNGIDASGTATTFSATGASGFISSTFNIASGVGAAGVGFSETGTFFVGAFGVAPTPGNPSGVVASNLGVGYNVYADISFIGTGGWSGADFNAQTGLFSLTLHGVGIAPATPDKILGTASLIPGGDTIAKITLLGGNAALTTLSGTFDFAPTAGFTGLGNFFQAPIPFQIGFSVGNFGGNAANTTYTVNGDGSISVFTPGPGLPAATGNLTFVTVPEPAALSLVGLALVGLGFASRRKAAKATAAA